MSEVVIRMLVGAVSGYVGYWIGVQSNIDRLDKAVWILEQAKKTLEMARAEKENK